MLNNEGQRELCYIVSIDAIEPIIGSDNCEAAVVGGWKVMIRKNTFKTGDLAVYFEIDSKVPEKEPFMFLQSKHFKIKTQKYTFGGKGNFISQGLLMPLSDFTDLFEYDVINGMGWLYTYKAKPNIKESKDTIVNIHDGLTELLGVKYSVAEDNKRKSNSNKYTKMVSRHQKLFKENKLVKWLYKRKWGKELLFFFLGKKSDKNGWPVGKFPGVSKTDQERIENMPWILEDKTPFIKTCKIDGTSATYILEKKHFNKYEYYVCSRNVRMMDENQSNYHSDDENVYWEVSYKYKIKEFLQKIIEDNNLNWICLQGEIAGITEKGKKIQGDPHNLGELRFFGFHLTDSENGRYNPLVAKVICQESDIEWVPILDTNYILPDDLDEFKKSADGPCDIKGSLGLREGFVYYSTKDYNLSFKNISNEYLLK